MKCVCNVIHAMQYKKNIIILLKNIEEKETSEIVKFTEFNWNAADRISAKYFLL